MNTYITLACLLAVLGLSQGSAIGAYGYGSPWIGSAVSTANLVKAAPISVIRTHAVAPVVTAPILRTVPAYGLGWGGLGWGGLGWGGLGHGGYGLGGYGGYGLGGHGGYGWGGHGGWSGAGVGNWGGWGWGGLGGKHYG